MVVFNAAIMFFQGGSALCAGMMRSGNSTVVRTALGLAISILSLLVLIQNFVRVDFGISWSALHTWLPKSWPRLPGAMNPNPAIAFLCCGLALALMDRVSSRVAATVVGMLISVAIGLALFDLIGKIVHLEFLYPSYLGWRMALGTAYALLALGSGVWLAWQGTAWMQGQPPMAVDRKLTYVAAWILAGLRPQRA